MKPAPFGLVSYDVSPLDTRYEGRGDVTLEEPSRHTARMGFTFSSGRYALNVKALSVCAVFQLCLDIAVVEGLSV